MQINSECVFCTNSEVKARVFLKTDLVKAFPTNIPIVPGHVLITPRRHIQRESELTVDEREAIARTFKVLRKVLTDLFHAEGFNFAWNEDIGQTEPHLHIHMLPRKKGDTGVTGYEPRKFLYRPGSRESTPESELKKISAMIRDKVDRI